MTKQTLRQKGKKKRGVLSLTRYEPRASGEQAPGAFFAAVPSEAMAWQSTRSGCAKWQKQRPVPVPLMPGRVPAKKAEICA